MKSWIFNKTRAILRHLLLNNRLSFMWEHWLLISSLTPGSCFIKTLFSSLHKQMFQKISRCSSNSVVGKGERKEIGTWNQGITPNNRKISEILHRFFSRESRSNLNIFPVGFLKMRFHWIWNWSDTQVVNECGSTDPWYDF